MFFFSLSLPHQLWGIIMNVYLFHVVCLVSLAEHGIRIIIKLCTDSSLAPPPPPPENIVESKTCGRFEKYVHSLDQTPDLRQSWCLY